MDVITLSRMQPHLSESIIIQSLGEVKQLISLDEAFEFAEWTSTQRWDCADFNKKWYHQLNQLTPKTTQELYQIFKKEKK